MSAPTPLLLHACCAPCSLEPLRLLREEGYDPIICWSNPNIQPVAEHDRRLATLRAWASSPAADVRVVEAGCDRDAWERLVAPFGMDRSRRCRACYALRLAEACRVAVEMDMGCVSTTLAVSPYQLFDVCGEVLTDLAEARGLEAVWLDFRPRYPEATRLATELGLYRQSYCGCRFSAAEAALQRQRDRDARRARHTSEARPR